LSRMADLIRRLRRPVPHTYGVDWIDDAARIRDWSAPAWILDVGAHVGLVSAELARRFPQCTLHAFEPVPGTFAALQARLRSRRQVFCHPVAVSDRSGEVRMTAVPNSQINRIVTDEQAGSKPMVTVETITLDSFLEAHGWPGIGLLKIDTEGFDLHVLRGAREAFARGSIDTFVAECTFNPRGAPHVDVVELMAMSRQLGFQVVAVYSDHVGKFCRGSGHANVLFARA
jgi:FkbM family methyltransferase